MLENVSAILKFWFGEDKNDLLCNAGKWFNGTPELDLEINERFAMLIPLAKEGKLDEWRLQPQSCLAYIILLDQFSRNAFRGTKEAFAQDDLALAACEQGREHKLDKDLNLIQRHFFYMPLQHSENVGNQRLCLALISQLVQEARETAPQYLHAMEEAFNYAQNHYDIIQNFGRFPHRNLALSRDSTQEELIYLEMPGNLKVMHEKVRWACRRGMLELDLFLVPFFENCYAELTSDEKKHFRQLLTSTDPELYQYLTTENTAPKELDQLVNKIRTFRYLHSQRSRF